jgi:peptide/nickel transport system permease protein
MARFLLRRLMTLIVTMLLVSLFVFLISEVVTGQSVCRRLLGQFATDEQVHECNIRMGLDRPLPVRYGEFLKNAVTGDFGVSIVANEKVSEVIPDRLGKTLLLGAIAFAVIMPIGLFLGIISALNEGKLLDRFVSVTSLSATAIPEIASGIFLLVIFVGWLGWLPGAVIIPPGDSLFQHPKVFILPVATLALVEVGYVTRITRQSMVEVLDAAYVRTAVLKGLPYRKVVWRHALRNALMAPIAVIMLHVNWLIGGIVVVEIVFGYPGLGRFTLDAAQNGDVFALEGATMVLVVIAVGTQILADIAYMLINPRVRFA